VFKINCHFMYSLDVAFHGRGVAESKKRDVLCVCICG
jgi:hypothetical protein